MNKPVIGALRCAFIASTLAAFTTAAAVEVDDDFNAGTFENSIWNTCQLTERLAWFDRVNPYEGRHSLVIRADESLGDVGCFAGVSSNPGSARIFNESREPLGPSLLMPDDAEEPGPTADGPVQRNELRLLDRYRHRIDRTHAYGMTFTISGDIPSQGSVRWVVGQWKHQGGDSPFLAQRFDNGVFHITVQVGECRCRVAKAVGKPDRISTVNAQPALHCRGTGDHNDGQVCEPEELVNGRLLRLKVEPGPRPELPDPKQDWVTMSYSIRGGWDGNAEIEICANGVLAATVTGPIGYSNWKKSQVKFKVGQYRDYMPGSSDLHVDSFWIRRGSLGEDDCRRR